MASSKLQNALSFKRKVTQRFASGLWDDKGGVTLGLISLIRMSPSPNVHGARGIQKLIYSGTSFDTDIDEDQIRFILRGEVLSLYRQIMKTLRHMPNETDRRELMSWARQDFRKNQQETDEELIRMMLTRGRMTLKDLSQTIPCRSSTLHRATVTEDKT